MHKISVKSKYFKGIYAGVSFTVLSPWLTSLVISLSGEMPSLRFRVALKFNYWFNNLVEIFPTYHVLLTCIQQLPQCGDLIFGLQRNKVINWIQC
jgi:hypothetical protein